jgi:hypothetical protein
VTDAASYTLDQQVKVRPQSPLRLQRTRAYSSRAQLAVGVAGPGPLQQEDHPVGAPQQDVDVHDAAVAIHCHGLGRLMIGAESVIPGHDRQA